jgi:hypothetical protein
MAFSLNSVAELQRYIGGVIERAKHHAQSVDNVIYPMLCLIVAHFDSQYDIKVRKYNNKTANMLWAHINNTEYAFCYNHTIPAIEIREGGMNGRVLHSIDNNKSIADLINIFENL